LAIRLTTEVGQSATTIRIEGKLTSAELPDLRGACELAGAPLRLDLKDLRSADMDGIRLLLSLAETGAELQGASPYVRYLLLEAKPLGDP
jgi:ABC-type transporter Mla MlaB component